MGDRGKTRIKCPSRSQGDGMENTTRPEHELIHTSCSPPDYYHKSFLPSQGKVKEPKFVPYEPYRAAVSPIVSPNHLHECIIDSQKVNTLASSVIRLYSDSEGKGFGTNCSVDCSIKVKTLEEKVAALEKEKKELSAQYQVQTEVNVDLKKLLVASLGEDVQLKVEFMTQDKAQLGREVLRLSTELERAREEARQHSICSELWEGKFKASSVMVRDLAQKKASLSRSLEQSTEGLQTILQEHNALFEALCSAYRNLEVIATSFDPGNKSIRRGCSAPVDLMQMGEQLKSLSNGLKERLLGKPIQPDARSQCVRQFTRAESKAHQLLQSTDQAGVGSDLSKCSPGMVACQVLPHACSRELDFCRHCCGEVLNV